MSVTQGRARSGFTLVEMLVALVLSGLVVGVILSFLIRQQRFYGAVGELTNVRERVRDATTILVADLRAASVSGDTIRVATDTAIELFTSVGASTVCTLTAAGIVVPPDTATTGAPLTSWLTLPDTADYALVFHHASSPVPTHHWFRLRIAAVGPRRTATACPPTTGLTTTADAGTRSYEITFTTAVPAAIRPGMPVRFVRRGRYSVYRASDGLWYLGYRRCNALGGACGVVQPVSGPYSAASGPPLEFRYYTATGAAWSRGTPATAISRVDIVARAASSVPLHIPGLPRAVWHDSAVASVGFRNAR